MKASQGIVAALATLVAAGAWAREPNMSDVKVWSQPTYSVVSHDEGMARTVMSQMGPIEQVLSKVLGRQTQPADSPTFIFIVRGSVWLRYLQPGKMIVGEFAPGRFANYLLLNTDSDGGSVRDAVNHEYTHLYLHTQFRGVIPLWFDEGLAEVMQETEFRKTSALVGTRKDYNVPGWVPLSRLLRIDKKSPEYLFTQTYLVHSESWAMVHRGVIAEPAFGKKMFAYLKTINDGVPIEDAVQSSFGMNIEQLEKQLISYYMKANYRVAKIDFQPPAELRTDVTRELSELQALEMLAQMMFDTGLRPDRLGEVIAAAERRAPESAAVRVLKLHLAVRDRDDAEAERLWNGLAPAAQDVNVARGIGLALFERVRESAPADSLAADARLALQSRALGLLQRSLDAEAHDPEAAWAFGMLAASLNTQLEPALKFLEAARQSAPRNSDLAMASALIHEARRQPEEMLASLADTARYSRSVDQRLWAMRRIEELRLAKKKSGG
jgi:hypothetical protein